MSVMNVTYTSRFEYNIYVYADACPQGLKTAFLFFQIFIH